MTTKKATRRALFTSIMALVMCLVMLVGTTFAWFTDSVTSGVNTIKSGNLDVKLTYAKGTETGEVTKDTHLFNDAALWEPGHVEYVVLTASNEGSLALKYKLAVNVFGETGSVNMLGDAFQLSSYLKYAVIDGDATEGDFDRDTLIGKAEPIATVLGNYTSEETALYPAGTEGQISSKTVTLVVWMPTTVGNEANHKTGETVPAIQLGVSLVATQYTAESDSFGKDYDEMAEYPEDANYPTGAAIVGLDGTYDSLTAAMVAWRESKDIVTTGGNMGGHPAELTSVDTISWVISGSVGTGDGTGVVGGGGVLLSGGYIYPSIAINNVYIKGVNNAELKNEIGTDDALSSGGKNVVYDGITFPEYVSFNSKAENVTFRNCTFKGGLKVMQASNVTVDSCKFEGDGTKDYAFFAQASTMESVVFTNNEVSNFQRGINVQDFSKTADVVISGNTIKNITGKADGFTYGSAIQMTNAKTFTVTNNTISDVAVNALHIYDGCAADSIVIKDNNISAVYLCWNQANYTNVTSSGNTVDVVNAGKCVTKTAEIDSDFALN